MMDCPTLLARPHLSMVTRAADGELACIQNLIADPVLVDGRADIETALGRLLGATTSVVVPKTLDLIGHSTPGKSLLWIGGWVIDSTNPTVTSFFRELADQEVFPHLGITALRLLGCRTADTTAGRSTIIDLAKILEVDVFGTRGLVYSAHCNEHGFADEHRYLLVGNKQLEFESAPPIAPTIEAWPRVLDIDALPSSADREPSGAWPHRLANENEMSNVLRFVRRRDGAQMHGLLAAPHSELVFPGDTPDTYRRAQVVLDGEFVRFYPQGSRAPGIVYAVEDAHALLELVGSLPTMRAQPSR